MSFSWNESWVWLVVALVVVGMGAILGMRRWRLPGSGRSLGGLRAAALALLGVLLLEPVLVSKTETQRRPRILVLADVSKSMNLTDVPRGSRLAAAQAILFGKDGLQGRLSPKFDLDWFAFSDSLEDAGPDRLRRLSKGSGSATDIYGALAALAPRSQGRPADAVLLLTDGCDNLGRRGELTDESLRLPIHGIAIGSKASGPRPSPNVRIAAAAAASPALPGHVVAIRALVEAEGVEAGAAQVQLTLGGRRVDSRQVSLTREEPAARLEFAVTPPGPGLYPYALEAARMPGEQDLSDNRRPCPVRVRGEKVRLLYVEGKPRWEYRFLRRLIENDPTFDAAFVVLTGEDKIYRQGEPARNRAFPETDEELNSYHVVILGDLPAKAFSDSQLRRLADFAAGNGRSLVMLGGYDSFGAGGYHATPLAEALPVAMSGPGDGQREGELRLSITPEGWEHPIFAGLRASGIGPGQLSRLPALLGCSRVRGLKTGAELLASAVAQGGREFPLLAVQRFGRGATLALTADTTWRWTFAAADSSPAGPAVYRQFWGSLLRWLAQQAEVGEEAEMVKAIASRTVCHPGDHIRLEVTGTGPQDRVSWRASGPTEAVELGTGTAADFAPREPGTYTATAAVTTRAGVRHASVTITVQAGGLEDQETAVNEKLLRELATLSGGSFLTAGEARALRIEAIPVRTRREQRLELTSAPYLLVLFVALVTTEWVLRRRRSLP